MTLKQRCFDALGIKWAENLADGLQVLRYNITTAYISHLDWIDDRPKQAHDFDSGGVGSNRFSTILLYFTDLVNDDAGGETVWTFGKPYQNDTDHPNYTEALHSVRSDPHLSTLFKKSSWQEKMVAECRSSLHTKPARAKATLFYSQHPDGRPDKRSKHGGCPVLDDGGGTKPKWAANLWVWNAPRMGYPEAPNKPNFKEKKKKSTSGNAPEKGKGAVKGEENEQKLVTFVNENEKYKDARLYVVPPPPRTSSFVWRGFAGDGRGVLPWFI